jgi:Protein of unknown function (DUF1588)/Protein of unknown function (DUF1592)/Protein of unknown function (DUF1585)
MNAPSSLRALIVVAAFVGGCGHQALPGEGASGAAGSGSAGSGAGEGGAGSSPGGPAGQPMTSGAAGTPMAGAGGASEPDGGAAGAPVAAPPLFIPPDVAIGRIARVLWQSNPDPDQVLPANIKTTGDLKDIVRQMLADPRAAVGVRAFYRWWLALGDLETWSFDPTDYPDVPARFAADIVGETETYGVEVTFQTDGTLQTLMTAPFTFINASLASIYGVPGVTGDELQRVTLPPGRFGLLTQSAFLVQGAAGVQTSPTHRGVFVARKFFCQSLPDPPPNEPPLRAPMPGVTGRTALEAETASAAACNACHSMMDPIGFAFEGFDPLGRARTTDNGAPIDTSNLVILQTMPRDAHVDGALALVNVLANDPGVESCFARQWLAFALGGVDVTTLNDTLAEEVVAPFTAAQFNIKELIVAVLTSEAFLSP